MKYIIFIILFLTACKAKQIDWATECSQRYPVKTEYIHGKDYYHTDTLKGDCVMVHCDPILLRAKCPPTLTITKTIHRTDTLVKENTAQIKTLERNLSEVNTKYQTLELIKQEAENTAKTARHQRNYLAIGLLVSIVIVFRKTIIKLIFPFV